VRSSAGRMLILVLAVWAMTGCSSRVPVHETHASLQVMTLNVRLPLASDGPNGWPQRRDAMATLIRTTHPDVLGTQELMRSQADDLSARLPDYAWFGVGRRGGDDDEHMGVFYRRDALRLLDSGHFWLSDTPELPGSISWGHPYPRMVTWGLFERVADGLRFHLLNTHLPYRPGDGEARLRGAGLILERVAALGDGPLIVLGDFNDRPDGAVHRRLRAVLDDAWIQAPTREGPAGTFHGFSGVAGERIDWILHRGLRVRRARVLSEPVAGRHVSDHFPLLVEFEPVPPTP
jgi:endonuclease/exonuclease/phosphatase family metal-dependent hydrolase